MIHLNEVTQAKYILETGEIDKNAAQYYRHKEQLDWKQTYHKLDEFMRQNYKGYVSASWEDTLEEVAKKAENYPPWEFDHVGITQSELDKILEMKSQKHQKLLFTLLCHAKIYNLASEKNNGWVNTEIPEIYRLANITVKHRNDKFLYLNDILQGGYISCSALNNDLNLRVNFIDMDGEPVLKITKLRDLGHEYLQFIGKENFIHCKRCGRLVKKTGNRRLYCKDCAKTVKALQDHSHYLARRAAVMDATQNPPKIESASSPL